MTPKFLKKLVRSQLANLGLHLMKKEYLPGISERKIYRHYLNQETFSVIFDIGANVGQTAKAFSQEFSDAKIFSFEPFEENFRKLKEIASQRSNVSAFRVALSDKRGSEIVLRDTNPFSEWNSLEKWTQENLAASSSSVKEGIELETGDNFCAEHKISKIDVLKTDTEGHDLAVLRGFSQMLKEGKISAIVSECGFPDDPSHTNFDDLNEFLKAYGFKFRGCFEVSHKSNGNCEYFNALFVASLPR